MIKTELGFDKEHTLSITMDRTPDQNTLNALKKNYLQHSNIKAVSFSSAYPSRNSGGQLLRGEGMEEDQNVLVWEWRVDEDIIEAFGLKLVAGGNFNPETENAEEKDCIINQTTMRLLGWDEENALGKILYISGNKSRCIGIIEDFHFASLRDVVEPLILTLKPTFRNNIILRLGNGDIKTTVDFIETEWKRNIPDAFFDYQFINVAFDRLYKNEKRTAQMFSGFSILAIIIASLGLFGLSTYETQMRAKEIGIRKAMGSTDLGIFRLLIGRFITLILAAFVVSIPVTYLFMAQWLNRFAYRNRCVGVLAFPFVCAGTHHLAGAATGAFVAVDLRQRNVLLLVPDDRDGLPGIRASLCIGLERVPVERGAGGSLLLLLAGGEREARNQRQPNDTVSSHVAHSIVLVHGVFGCAERRS